MKLPVLDDTKELREWAEENGLTVGMSMMLQMILFSGKHRGAGFGFGVSMLELHQAKDLRLLLNTRLEITKESMTVFAE